MAGCHTGMRHDLKMHLDAASRDEDGTGKGDGLVTYLKAPSVDLAIQILDGTPLRDGDTRIMSVSQVTSEYKATAASACTTFQNTTLFQA